MCRIHPVKVQEWLLGPDRSELEEMRVLGARCVVYGLGDIPRNPDLPVRRHEHLVPDHLALGLRGRVHFN